MSFVIVLRAQQGHPVTCITIAVFSLRAPTRTLPVGIVRNGSVVRPADNPVQNMQK